MKSLIPFLFITISSCSLSQKNNSLVDQIIQKGFLIVGMTGDYAPFSEWKSNQFQGIDVEMAKDLAQSMGVKIKFFKTSWPTLLKGLKNKKFDIAMSGFSKKLKRLKVGLFFQRVCQHLAPPL